MEKDVDVRLRVNCCDTCTIRCGLPGDLCPLIGLSPVSYLLSALAEASKNLTDEEILKYIDDTKKIMDDKLEKDYGMPINRKGEIK